MEDEILLGQAGSAQAVELDDTNMYQTDTRDQAADRDAEAYEGFKHFRTSQKIEADVALFVENPRLVKMRQGVGTYGYCAWCDAGMSNPTNLWNHYQSVSFGMHAGGTVYSLQASGRHCWEERWERGLSTLLHLQRS